jgi:quercetin dioxygenase-like cupin family protein
MQKETVRIGQVSVRFLLEAADTNGSLAMFEFMVPVGAKVPLPHYHKDYDETIYGVDGVITFTVDGKAVDIDAGESLFIPRGVVHGFKNLKQVDAKVLAVLTPALIGSEFFREMAAVVNSGAPPDVEMIKAVMGKYGLIAVMEANPAFTSRGSL